MIITSSTHSCHMMCHRQMLIHPCLWVHRTTEADVRDIGVVLDSGLDTSAQVSNACRGANYITCSAAGSELISSVVKTELKYSFRTSAI